MHFLKIASNVDVMPVLLAIRQMPQIWGRSFRTTFPESPHREILDVVLRCQVPERSEDVRECYWHPVWACLPQARPLIYSLMARVEGERLGRVLLTWSVPGARIYPHRDIGPKESGHYDTERYWSRFHIPLETNEQCTFTCGEEGEEETVIMEAGSCWWFNSALMHSCANHGPGDRVHLVVDVHTSTTMGG